LAETAMVRFLTSGKANQGNLNYLVSTTERILPVFPDKRSDADLPFHHLYQMAYSGDGVMLGNI